MATLVLIAASMLVSQMEQLRERKRLLSVAGRLRHPAGHPRLVGAVADRDPGGARPRGRGGRRPRPRRHHGAGWSASRSPTGGCSLPLAGAGAALVAARDPAQPAAAVAHDAPGRAAHGVDGPAVRARRPGASAVLRHPHRQRPPRPAQRGGELLVLRLPRRARAHRERDPPGGRRVREVPGGSSWLLRLVSTRTAVRGSSVTPSPPATSWTSVESPAAVVVTGASARPASRQMSSAWSRRQCPSSSSSRSARAARRAGCPSRPPSQWSSGMTSTKSSSNSGSSVTPGTPSGTASSSRSSRPAASPSSSEEVCSSWTWRSRSG